MWSVFAAGLLVISYINFKILTPFAKRAGQIKQMLKIIQSRFPTRSYLPIVQSSSSQARTMSSLMHRRQGGGFRSLMRALDDFDNPLSNRSLDNQFMAYSPRFDFRETKDGYHLDGELPGVEKKDIDIEFPDQSTMNIKGHTEHATSTEGAEGSWWCMERSTGDFKRSFSFPNPVDHDHVDATLKNGILSITIPKAEVTSTAKHIDIK
ncbi:HSP20-like chaperone [Aspergillus cavernicola]|uniref:HSP20-like chaperone n=1 Tax=Aspergillus cavernicola TaxID=176166 RepID=A0ABR4I3F1_9EURO